MKHFSIHFSILIRSAVLFSTLAFFAVPALASASVSVSIQSLSPSTNISVGTSLTFGVSASGFTSPSYTVSDSLGGSTIVPGDINGSGQFSWTPTNSDVGTHNLTIAVNDGLGNSATTTESITVSAAPSVSIGSVSPGSTITVGQALSFNVSVTGFTNPSYQLGDSFNGSTLSNADINSSGQFNWTPTNASQDGTHTITVYSTDSEGHSASASETITVQSAATLVIGAVSPSVNVSPGQTVSFTATASNFSSPSYSLNDSFSGSSINNSYINSSGQVSWTPDLNDDGTHTITIFATDSSGHSATASVTINVTGSAVGSSNGASIQGFVAGSTVIVGQPVTFTVAASGFTSPVFSVSDSFGGSSLSNADINSAGYLSWTPNSNDVGTHNLTIYVNDSSGHSGNVTLSLTVAQPNITIASMQPGTDVAPNSPLTFTVSPQGFTSPSYTLSDSFSNTSLTNASINSSGQFSWTPTTAQDGTHTITVYATDASGRSANTSVTIDVSTGTNVALSAVSPSSNVAPGTPVSFSAYAYSFTSPTFTVQDSFAGSSLTNADINSSGAFSWTPTAADTGTHVINVTATDAYGHYGTIQATIVVSGSGSVSGTTLGELEAELQQDETQISSLGGATGITASFVFTEDMSPGMSDSQVAQLQTVLEKEGDFSGAATGYYGPLTSAAVDEFQSQHGIAQVGIVGPQTLAALNALMVTSTSTASTSATVGDGYVFSDFIGYGDTSNDVTELQKRLTAFGVYSGPVTGYFGALTQTAVKAFQAKNGIEQAGYVGPATRAALNQ